MPRPWRVTGGIPGEEADVDVVHRGGNYVHARWAGSPNPSPDRVTVRCEHIDRCGGCPWLHVAGARAHQERADRVAGLFRAVGIDVPVEPRPAPAGAIRQLVKLVAADGTDSRRRSQVTFGAYRPRSHDVSPIPGCLALAPALQRLTRLPPLRLPPGIARYLLARRSTVDGRVLATLVIQDDAPEIHSLERVLRDAGVDGLTLHRNRLDGDAILDPRGETVALWGVDTLRESVAADVFVDVGPTDFFQTNPVVGRQIWAELPSPGAALVDLYAGVGSVVYAAFARNKALRGFAVEQNPGAVGRGRATATRLGADVAFLVGAAGDVAIPASFQGATVVLNPPRGGTVAAVRTQVAALHPSQIVYISCHPAPLANDLAGWVAAGWRVETVRAYDMFPGTPHVETVAVLSR